jgi:hypothetical protein
VTTLVVPLIVAPFWAVTFRGIVAAASPTVKTGNHEIGVTCIWVMPAPGFTVTVADCVTPPTVALTVTSVAAVTEPAWIETEFALYPNGIVIDDGAG